MLAYATSPAAWTFGNNVIPGTISAAPAGSNRKLIVVLTARDTDAWAVTDLQVGGQSYDYQDGGTSPTQGDLHVKVFEYLESTIASMSGVAVTNYTSSQTINPIGMTHYWLADVNQAQTVVTHGDGTSAAATVTTSGNTANDLVVIAGAADDDVPNWTSFGSGCSLDVEGDNAATLSCGIGSGNTTVTSHDCTVQFTNDMYVAAMVHVEAASTSASLYANHINKLQSN